MITIKESFRHTGYPTILKKLKPYDKFFRLKFNDASGWEIQTAYTKFSKESDYKFYFTKSMDDGIYFSAEIEFQKRDIKDEEIKKHIAFLKKQFILFDFRIGGGKISGFTSFNIFSVYTGTEQELQSAIDGVKKAISALDRIKRSGGRKRV